MGAVLVAAAVVVSGCGADDGEGTRTSASPEAPVNPWDLPLEERPDLFDPCAELPIEAVEEALGGPVELDEQLRIERPGELLSCGWKSNEAIFGVVGTWKSREEYISDTSFVHAEIKSGSRRGLRLVDKSDLGANRCRDVFFSASGAVFISLDLFTGTTAFKGKDFTEPCKALTQISQTILSYTGTGSF